MMAINPLRLTASELGVCEPLTFSSSEGPKLLTSVPSLLLAYVGRNDAASSPSTFTLYRGQDETTQEVGLVAVQGGRAFGLAIPGTGVWCPSGIYVGGYTGSIHGIAYAVLTKVT